jgi:hypothetical protein
MYAIACTNQYDHTSVQASFWAYRLAVCFEYRWLREFSVQELADVSRFSHLPAIELQDWNLHIYLIS